MTARKHPGPVECHRRRHHVTPFAYTSDEDILGGRVGIMNDEPPPIFPLQGDPSNYEIALNPTSTVSVEADTHAGTTTASGTIGILVDEDSCDRSGRCDFTFTKMELKLDDFTLERCAICRDFDVTNVSAILSGAPFTGTLDRTGAFAFSRNAQVWAELSGKAEGNDFSMAVEATHGFSGRFVGSSNTFALEATFENASGVVDLQLTGTIENHPPMARIDAPEHLECGISGSFSASRSSDPNGAIISYMWAASESTRIGPHSGANITMSLPVGEHEIGLIVTGTSGLHGFARHSITVGDSVPPTIEPLADIKLESCEEGTSIEIPAIDAEDICDGSVQAVARIVMLNGVNVNVPVSGPLQLEPDSTATIAYSATDTEGNTAATDINVSTFRGASCCPTFPGKSGECWVGSEGDDVIDGGNGGDWIFGGLGNDRLTGGNGPDVIYGGPGDDILLGMNGPDLLYGGAGNDRLEGGAGPDELEGGSGVDTMLGGDGPDVFWIRSSCHALSGEIIDGGSGRDVLYSPLTIEELVQRGVTITDVEEIVIIEDEGGCDV